MQTTVNVVSLSPSNATIDLLTAQWCEPVNLHNPYVNQTFYINHFQTNRSKISRWKKIKEFYHTFRKALPALDQADYDFYIDIRYTDAVAHFVLPFIVSNIGPSSMRIKLTNSLHFITSSFLLV